MLINDVLSVNSRQQVLTSHGTPKPLELLTTLIEATTVQGQLVCDPFAGSGSTLIAAKQCDRRYFGIEKFKKYFRQGQARLHQSIAVADSYQDQGSDTCEETKSGCRRPSSLPSSEVLLQAA